MISVAIRTEHPFLEHSVWFEQVVYTLISWRSNAYQDMLLWLWNSTLLWLRNV